jgi:hypothetical protein
LAHGRATEPALPEVLRAHADALPAVERRADVEVERGHARERAAARVEVDHIAHARAAAVDDPVVPVERRRVPVDGVSVSGCVVA